LAVRLSVDQGPMLGHVLAAVFFGLSTIFVWRSFYGMRIGSGD
jgi:K(+)-stimulated pyrophosphate-energized sodium pump